MPPALTRDRMIQALQELPPDVTLEDAIERLILLAKIEAGIAEFEAG